MTLYTQPSCPQCAVLKRTLGEKGISYTEVSDLDRMLNKGFRSAPMVETDDGSILDFAKAWMALIGGKLK